MLRCPSRGDYNYHPRTRTTAAHCEATRGRVMASATSCLIVPNCNGVDTADAVHHAVTASAYASRRWQYDNSMTTAATSCLIVPNCNGVDTVLRVWSGCDCNRVRSPPLLIQLATSCLSYAGSAFITLCLHILRRTCFHHAVPASTEAHCEDTSSCFKLSTILV